VKVEDIIVRRIPPIILQRARELRHPQTPTEQILWRYLRDSQLDGIKFRRQHPLGTFILDFYCPQSKLVIEIDGPSHSEQVEYDMQRTAWLECQGCHVIRFTNQDVTVNLPAVLDRIREHCKKNL
jgi:very-short-patch-repair endonuclease